MPRTYVQLDLTGRGNAITGAQSVPVAAACTNDAATTAVLFVAGLPLGRVINTSGGSVTITFLDARTQEGTALTTYDEDGVGVPALVLPNNGSAQIPTALAGCTWLIPKLSSGTATLYFTFGR